ncbi:MAG: hypothetical protein JWO06_1924 [Bacteroidota bacterium]|nr:hypothetical protein [Bacteroidota bacterium]
MSHSELKPRQKMINLIYLVLTAILALNVSGEVLDAFKTVNDGIGNSNTSLKTKNSDIYTDFGTQFLNDSARAEKAYKKALQARALSDKLYVLLEQYKKQMVTEAGGIDPETGKIKRDDDINVSTGLFVENEGKKGKELKKEIENTRQDLLNLLEAQDRKEAEQSFALKIDGAVPGKTWEYAKFNSVPVVAAVTLLTKYQNDLLSAEGNVVAKLYSSVYKNVDKVDRFAAKVIAPGSYILQGESYKADVMVAAYNSTKDPEVFLGQFTPDVKADPDGGYKMIASANEALPLVNPVKVDVQHGIGKLAMAGAATGNKKYTGVVRVKNTDGVYKFFPFEGQYQVAPKTAVVSPKMLNVLYIGLDNPVDVSVPGVAQSDVIATFEGDGKLVASTDGGFKALVTTPGTTKVKVSAKIDGRVVPMGEKQFRIKRIPNPVTTIDGISSGGTATATFIDQRAGVVPKSDDFIYGSLPWKVIKYVVSIHKGMDLYKIENEGPVFNQKIKTLKKGLKKGDTFFVDEIIVMGPDQKQRSIPPLAYNITAQ